MNKLPFDTQHPVLAADGPEVTMQAIVVNYEFGIDTIEEFNIIHLPEADWVEAGQGYSKVVHEYTFGSGGYGEFGASMWYRLPEYFHIGYFDRLFVFIDGYFADNRINFLWQSEG